jgi:hypothetical protein
LQQGHTSSLPALLAAPKADCLFPFNSLPRKKVGKLTRKELRIIKGGFSLEAS